MSKNLFIIGIACLCIQLVVAQSFQQQCLDAHNNYRKQHGVPPLELDSSLTKFAQEWADYLAKNNKFEHRSNNKYGENLYAIWGTNNVAGDAAVKSWYDEIKDYNFAKPGFGSATGHFTQVIWKNSKKVGCAIAKTGNSAYVVANYDPPGNYLGQFPQNVLAKK